MSDERERCPPWISQDYGWDFVDQVDWQMLRHNLKCADNVLANPVKFPKADRPKVERIANALHAFLSSHAQHL